MKNIKRICKTCSGESQIYHLDINLPSDQEFSDIYIVPLDRIYAFSYYIDDDKSEIQFSICNPNNESNIVWIDDKSKIFGTDNLFGITMFRFRRLSTGDIRCLVTIKTVQP